MIPVGNTKIFSRMEYQTLRKPKNTPNISKMIKWESVPSYWAKIQSKMGLILASVRFYDFHIQQALVHQLKSLLNFYL